MKLSSTKKKWLTGLSIFFLVLALLVGVVYYAAFYRFKDILKAVVANESNGTYDFDASKIKLSILDKNIFIENAVLTCKDTSNVSPHYNIRIPAVYLSIDSWRDIVFKRKISVDSLSIAMPSLITHDHGNKQKQKHVSFQISKVVEIIQKTLDHLKVRSFSLQNGAFTYSNKKNRIPFVSNRINLVIKNFSDQKRKQARLFGTDDVDMLITDQYWQLPDGLHEMSFKKLHFSGSNQFFELDSCSFRSTNPDSASNISFSADKLFFNSTQLSALYEKEDLIIDTLLLYHPVFHLHSGKKRGKDSTQNVTQSLNHLFKGMSFKYIDVKDGQLLMNENSGSDASTQRTNLTIYNLNILPDSNQVTTDSIHLTLNNTRFVTRDSLFELSIQTFSWLNKDVVLTNAVYGPTAINHNEKGLIFKAPYLRLKNLSPEDLLDRKLKGTDADLYHPEITLFDRRKSRTETKKPKGSIDQFFKTLHGLSELISVDNFNIVGGNVHYKSSAGSSPVSVEMKNINMLLLLNKFFVSDSLIDIKRSMPMLKVESIVANTDNLKLNLHNYHFNGTSRHNHIDDFSTSLSNGTTISGNDLYWEILDWDLMQKHQIIQVEYIRLKELNVMLTGEKRILKTSPQKKDLPVINIARIDADHINFNQHNETKHSSLHFDAKEFCVSGVGSEKRFFTWEEASGVLNNITYKNEKAKVSVDKLTYNNEHESVLHNTLVDIKNEKGTTKLNIPISVIRMNTHSTDFSDLNIHSLVLNDPEIELDNTASASREKKKKAFSMPLNLNLDQLAVNNASVHYKSKNAKDTITVTTNVNVSAQGLHTQKHQEKFLTYNKAQIDLVNTQFNKHQLDISLPKSSVVLTKGVATNNNGIAFTSGILFSWFDLKLQKEQTDSTGFLVEKLSGSFNDPSFAFRPKMKLKWQSMLNLATISNGSVNYRGKNITANVGTLTWSPAGRTLSVKKFSVLPKLSMEESFKTGWQRDYMEVRGESVAINGIDFNRQPDDSSLVIKRVTANGIALTTTRDKHMPFQHGIEKSMPTILISSIKFPIKVDSVLVQNSSVTVNEISDKTNKKGTVPLHDINAILTNVNNTPGNTDSLTIVANAKLLDYHIRYLRYTEAYGDSLSNFFMHVNASRMALPDLSHVTVPLAAIRIDRGTSDTLYARWTGNTHAAVGQMDFFYDGLKIRLLDKNDLNKKSFFLSIVSSLANTLVLNKNNDKSSRIFFVRDKEKFVFNYWIKSILGGLSTSAGLKKNKKVYKQYRKVQEQYSLPEYENR